VKKNGGPVVLIDSHVHLYSCYDLPRLFDSAHENFCKQANELGSAAFDSVLLLTESAGHNYFSSIRDGSWSHPSGKLGHWRVFPTGEPYSVILKNNTQDRIFLIAGRQIETSERIEVSALFTDRMFTEGRSLEETVFDISDAKALAVLPWGVGKWLGQRGRILTKAISTYSTSVLLADNGSRPVFWPRPNAFALAEQLGVKILAGSDPLPISGDEKRIGSFGFVLPGPLDESRPGADIRQQIHQLRLSPARFGRLQGLKTFLKNRRGLKESRASSPGKLSDSKKGVEAPDIETSSDDYAQRFAGRAGQYMLQVQARSLANVLAEPVGDKILDVGGGHGQLTKQLLSRGFKVTVLASDPCCRTRLAPFENHANFCFVSGNLLDMPFADRSFDCLISVRLISHIEAREQLFREFCRVASQTIIVDYPSWYSLNALTPLLFGLKKLIEHNTRTYHSFSGRELASDFSRHGFQASARSAQFFLPMFLHRWFGASSLLQKLERWAKAARITSLLGSPVVLRLDRSCDP
jgi:SAM-dependent methyltransferase